jgi:hypothetical protein
MAESYYSDYLGALATLKEDGQPVAIFTESESGGYDDLGNDLSIIGESFNGYGITTGYSAYYIANDMAKAGDVKLIFTPSTMSDEYLAFFELVEKGTAKAFATIDGVKWRLVSVSQVKPTSTQIIVKAQLRR